MYISMEFTAYVALKAMWRETMQGSIRNVSDIASQAFLNAGLLQDDAWARLSLDEKGIYNALRRFEGFAAHMTGGTS